MATAVESYHCVFIGIGEFFQDAVEGGAFAMAAGDEEEEDGSAASCRYV